MGMRGRALIAVAACALVGVLALVVTAMNGREIGSADYRRYQMVAAENEALRGPMTAALNDDGIITTGEGRRLDAQIREMAEGSYQVTGDARGELEHELARRTRASD